MSTGQVSGTPLSFRWRLGGALALAIVAYALYWNVLVAVADWHFHAGTPQSIHRAMRIAPGNPEYYNGMALADPASAVPSLEQAARLSPVNSDYRIELALAAEQAGDLTKAEASFREARRLDRTFVPSFALAEFYARHHQGEKFWQPARTALEMSFGDVTDLFRDCWALSSDARAIFDRAIPERPAVLTRYLDFLVGENRLDAAAPIAAKLREKADSGAALLRYCDRLLASGRGEEAMEIWKGLAVRKLIPYRPDSLFAGAEALTNGDFGQPPLKSGFDWRFAETGGIDIDREGQPPAISVTFTGKQPESSEILSQYVALLPDREYQLSVKYRTRDIAEQSGLSCVLVASDSRDLLDGSGVVQGGAENDRELTFRFRTKTTTKVARLVFTYRRMTGTMRIEGNLILRRFSVRLIADGSR